LVWIPGTPLGSQARYDLGVMRASCRLKSTSIAALLLTALAFGQAEQPTPAQQTSSQQTGEQPTAQPTAKPWQTTPQSVAGAARASRHGQESAPPAKIYKNKDLKDLADTGNPTTASPGATPTSAAHPPGPDAPPNSAPTAAQIDAAQIQKDRAFEAQAKVFKSQILAEKRKIVGIQNRIADLKYQFDTWSTEYAQDPTDAEACWTSSYYAPYYKDWCDAGRKLKAQYDASQRQLDQEKARLDQMQENIRRQGYGNAVYDPD
jgi:hypothetical protein